MYVVIICLFIIITCSMFPRIELFSMIPFNTYLVNSKSTVVVADDIKPIFPTDVSYYERTNEEFQLIVNELISNKNNIDKDYVRHNAKSLELRYIDMMKNKILSETSLGDEGYVIVYVHVKDLLKSMDGSIIVIGSFCIYKQNKIVGKEISFRFETGGKDNDIHFHMLKVNGNITEDNINLLPYDTINHSFGSSSLSSSLIESSYS